MAARISAHACRECETPSDPAGQARPASRALCLLAGSEHARMVARRALPFSTMHLRQRPLPSDIESVWLAALADAEIDPAGALLYCFPGSECGGYNAHTWMRSHTISQDGALSDLSQTLSEMNDEECIDAYRVALWMDRGIEATAALLRHELEHGLQLEAHGQRLIDLYGLCIDVLNERAAGLVGGSLLYQMIPMEFDANAAASVFARVQFGDERVNRLLADKDADSAALRSLLPPPRVGTLPKRMVQFLATMPDLCRRLARRHEFDFRWRLNREWPGAGELWHRMVEEDELRSAR